MSAVGRRTIIESTGIYVYYILHTYIHYNIQYMLYRFLLIPTAFQIKFYVDFVNVSALNLFLNIHRLYLYYKYIFRTSTM